MFPTPKVRIITESLKPPKLSAKSKLSVSLADRLTHYFQVWVSYPAPQPSAASSAPGHASQWRGRCFIQLSTIRIRAPKYCSFCLAYLSTRCAQWWGLGRICWAAGLLSPSQRSGQATDQLVGHCATGGHLDSWAERCRKLLGTYEFKLRPCDRLTTIFVLTLAVCLWTTSSTWSLLILNLWCTSTVNNFAHVSHIQSRLRVDCAIRILPAVVLGTTILVTLTLFCGGDFACFLFYGIIHTLSNPYQCPSLEGQEQNQETIK